MSYYDDASLMFLAGGGAQKDGKAYSIKPTDGTGDFTFSRGSNLAATRVGAGPNYYIEKGRENLLLQSNNFNTTWVKTSATVTSDVIAGPLGELADSVFANAGSGQHRVLQTPVSTGMGTFSMYIKQKELSRIVIHLLGVNKAMGFDCSNNTTFTAVGVAADAEYYAITDAGNGWSKIEVFEGGTTTRVDIYIANPVAGGNNAVWTGDGTSEIYISSAQFELGTISTPYIETTTTTGTAGILEDTPRFNYSFGASCPSLLLEPSRTNVVTNSEYLNGVEWNGKINVSFGTNQTISPEGLLNSASIIENTTNGSHFAYEDFTLTSGASYAISIYAKKNGVNRNLRFNDGGLGWSSGFNGVFDLTAGTATGGVMEDVGNGWYRCSVTGTTNATASRLIIYPTLGAATSYPGDGTSGVFLYGFQIEAGSYVSSYIPNHSGGGSVTRAADVCGGAGDASTFNSTEGVLYAEIAALDNTQSASQYITISDGTYNNRLSILYSNGATNKIRAFLRVGGAPQVDFNSSLTNQKDFNKIAFKYKQNDFALWVNGIEVATDTSGSTISPDTLDELSFSEIGSFGGTLFNGKTKQVLTFKTALSDADLAALTTI